MLGSSARSNIFLTSWCLITRNTVARTTIDNPTQRSSLAKLIIIIILTHGVVCVILGVIVALEPSIGVLGSGLSVICPRTGVIGSCVPI
jgi:uncharacterized membrane protein